ncbi:MAG: hypothetical protein KDA88_14275 [Planctomycetaceae bacterium]|nr:hypothetical protein [Planctomycetaceae bacterium]MCB9949569.1 hypothetical protein [Planctomycetaceae bacterium]
MIYYNQTQLGRATNVSKNHLYYLIKIGRLNPPTMRLDGVSQRLYYSEADFKIACKQIEEIKRNEN